jgi:hypothetical protein
VREVAGANEAITGGEGGLVELTLTLAPAYRTLATRSEGLSGTVSVLFTAAGRAALRQSITVSFLSKVKSSTAKSERSKASKLRHRR